MVFPAEAEWPMRLQIVRLMKGQTQTEVADIVGTTRKQVYLWETGKSQPAEYTRRRLAKWAGVPESQLFKGIK